MRLIISLITATFNSEDTIRSTLESVRLQDYANLEYIVIDGGSTDNTRAIVEQYGDMVSIFESERDNGIYDALNKGIKKASGDVVGFLHSDDFFSSYDVLSKIAEQFQQRSLDAVYSDLDYVDPSDSSRVVRHWHSGEFSEEKLKIGWMPPHPTFYMRRFLYESWGYFNENLKISADYESMLRYLKHSEIRIAYIPEVLIKMRTGGQSNSSIKNILLKSSEDMEAMRLNNIPVAKALIGKNLSKIPQLLLRQ